MLYRAKVFWKYEGGKGGYYNDYFLDMEFAVKNLPLKLYLTIL